MLAFLAAWIVLDTLIAPHTQNIKHSPLCKELGFMVYLDESAAEKTKVSATLSYNIGAHAYSHTALLPVSDAPMANFRDTAYLWAEKDIDYLFEQGIVKGCGDGTYRPLNNISRAEFASIIARSFTFEEVEGTPISFTDIQNHWAKEDITKLSSLGIVVGYQDKFRPNDAITRQEAATVLNRILKYEGAESPTFSDLNDQTHFNDFGRKQLNHLESTLSTGYFLYIPLKIL